MKILSLDIYKGAYSEFFEKVKSPLNPTLVFTPNPEILMRASGDREFMEILSRADYLTPDANGLYTASLIQEGVGYFPALFRTLFDKKELVERYGELIRGSSLTKDLVDYVIEHDEKILMIDNYRIEEPKNPFEIKKMEIQSRFPELFAEKFPSINITILFDGEKSTEEIAKMITEKDIRYVFSCIGMKEQEKRLVEIFAHLPASQKVVGLGVGSSFDYLLGLQKRAPTYIQDLGLEWLYRLLLDPRSRWKRIKTALIHFPRLIQNSR